MQNQHTPSPAARKRLIPRHTDPAALAITDGHVNAGYVVQSDGSWFAFDADGYLIGEFRHKAEAINAVPVADTGRAS